MKNVEDIYPLSPMQQGMLFHTVLDPQAGDYLTQLTGTMDGRTTLDAFRNAWREVIRRHAVLRTGFVWETLDQPLQVVHREAEMPCTEHDWRGRADIDGAFEKFLAEDRAAGIDLASPPLMRLTVFEVGEARYRFVWTHHHLLLDGWSLPLLMQELFASAHPAAGGGCRYRSLGHIAITSRGSRNRTSPRRKNTGGTSWRDFERPHPSAGRPRGDMRRVERTAKRAGSWGGRQPRNFGPPRGSIDSR